MKFYIYMYFDIDYEIMPSVLVDIHIHGFTNTITRTQWHYLIFWDGSTILRTKRGCFIVR